MTPPPRFTYGVFVMPITKSAIKSARQSEVRRAELQPYRTKLKTMSRKFMDLVKGGKKEDALKLLPQVFKTIDTAAKKNLIHKKNAARRKSGMSKLVK